MWNEKYSYLERNWIIWHYNEWTGMFSGSRSVPIRNDPFHRNDWGSFFVSFVCCFDWQILRRSQSQWPTTSASVQKITRPPLFPMYPKMLRNFLTTSTIPTSHHFARIQGLAWGSSNHKSLLPVRGPLGGSRIAIWASWEPSWKRPGRLSDWYLE
jgi:hypothetical protein